MRATATIHDDYGQMLAELPLATNIDRLLSLSGHGAFSLDVPSSDVGAALLSEGRTIVIWSQRMAAQAAYSREILSLAPRGYWRLGELPAVSAADSSGNGYTGTYNGSPSGAPGLLLEDTNRAMVGTGSNGGVSLPSLGVMATWSIAYWTKRGASTGRMYDRHFSTAPTERIELGINYTNSKLKFLDASGWTETSITLALDELAFLCWTFDGATLTLYKNGASVYSASRGRSLTAIASSIGYKLGAAEGITDTLDEFAIFPTALGASDVLRLHAARSGRTAPAPCLPPYVGRITHIEENSSDQVYEVTGDNCASVFYDRNLPQDCKFVNQTAGRIASQMLLLANSSNPTGVYPLPTSVPGSFIPGTFDASGAKFGDALDDLSDITGEDWWLEQVIQRNRIISYLAWGIRGFDKSHSVVLEEGIHFASSSYIRDILGTASSVTTVGGTGAMSDRVVSVQAIAPIGINYGFALNREVAGFLPLDEDESVLSEAARRMLERPPMAAETLVLTINNTLDWGSIQPGDLARVLLPSIGPGGVDRDIRILAMQPDEAACEMDLAIEVI